MELSGTTYLNEVIDRYLVAGLMFPEIQKNAEAIYMIAGFC